MVLRRTIATHLEEAFNQGFLAGEECARVAEQGPPYDRPDLDYAQCEEEARYHYDGIHQKV